MLHGWPHDGNAFANKKYAHHAESLHGDQEIVSIRADGANIATPLRIL